MSSDEPLIDFSLAPLSITPEMAAAARAHNTQQQSTAPARTDAHPPAAPPPPEDNSELGTLRAMFPDYDNDVLGSVLASHGGNMENAINDLLAMGSGPGTARISGTATMPTVNSDEELALALFQQFAEEMEVPEEIRRDPARYDDFVREQFARELQQEGSQLATRAEETLGGGGGRIHKAGLLERIKKMQLPGSRKPMSTVKVEGGSAPLLG